MMLRRQLSLACQATMMLPMGDLLLFLGAAGNCSSAFELAHLRH